MLKLDGVVPPAIVAGAALVLLAWRYFSSRGSGQVDVAIIAI